MRRRFSSLWLMLAALVVMMLTGCEQRAPERTLAPPGTTIDLTPSPAPTQIAPAGTPAVTATATRVAIITTGTPAAVSTPTRVVALPTNTPVPVATATPVPATSTPVPQPTPTTPAQAFPYVVQAGDTLSSIADKFNTTVAVLKALNNLESDSVTAGQTLIIPGTPPAATPTTAPTAQKITYVVKAGDNLFRIGLRFGVPWQTIARANGIVNPANLQIGQVLVIPTTGTTGRTYTVKAGDTLTSIALRFNTTVQAIMIANNLTNSVIMPGQVLKIPS